MKNVFRVFFLLSLLFVQGKISANDAATRTEFFPERQVVACEYCFDVKEEYHYSGGYTEAYISTIYTKEVTVYNTPEYHYRSYERAKDRRAEIISRYKQQGAKVLVREKSDECRE